MPKTPSPIGNIISAGSGIIGAAIGITEQRRQDKINRTRQLEDFKMLNEYNSPIQQMQRFKEAGLNPNLIYGQTNMTSGMPSSYQNKGAIDPTIAAQVANIAADTALKSAQKDTVLEDYRDKKRENDIQDEAFENVLTSDREALTTNEFNKRINQAQIIQQELDNIGLQNENIKAQTKILEQQYINATQQEKQIIIQNETLTLQKAVVQAEADLAKQGIFKGDEIWTRKMLQEMSPQALSAFNFLQEMTGAGLKIFMSKNMVPLSAQQKQK